MMVVRSAASIATTLLLLVLLFQASVNGGMLGAQGVAGGEKKADGQVDLALQRIQKVLLHRVEGGIRAGRGG